MRFNARLRNRSTERLPLHLGRFRVFNAVYLAVIIFESQEMQGLAGYRILRRSL